MVDTKRTSHSQESNVFRERKDQYCNVLKFSLLHERNVRLEIYNTAMSSMIFAYVTSNESAQLLFVNFFKFSTFRTLYSSVLIWSYVLY